MKSLFLPLLLALMFPTSSVLSSAAERPRISIYVYNVENLFDVEKDAGKLDWEFLPRGYRGKKEGCRKMANPRFVRNCLETDWSEKKLDLKISQIKRVVEAMGPRPDMLALVEVENQRVLSRLALALGYEGIVLHEGPDERGIDTALLYRTNSSAFTFVRSEGIRVKMPISLGTGATREILRAEFKLKDKESKPSTLFVYVNHWPSQASPAASRYAAAEILISDIQERMARSEKSTVHTVAVGDFNTTDQDEPHPFRDLLTKKSNAFQIHDVHEVVRAESPKLLEQMPLGTVFYPPEMTWSRFDRIFVSESLLDTKEWEVRPNTYRIIAEDFMSRTYRYSKGPHKGSAVTRVPMRYETNAVTPEKAGFSDHFPVGVHLAFEGP